MTPKYITPCFVKVTAAGKRKKVCYQLVELGYRPFSPMFGTDIIYVSDNHLEHDTELEDDDFNGAVITNEIFVENYTKREFIDCGENIDLFLALAGMREDTDQDQYFTDGKDWYKHISIKNLDPLFDERAMFLHRMQLNGFRRATAEEIIEHFKSKCNE